MDSTSWVTSVVNASGPATMNDDGSPQNQFCVDAGADTHKLMHVQGHDRSQTLRPPASAQSSLHVMVASNVNLLSE